MKKKEPELIKFQAQISGIRTTVVGGSSVTFSLSGTEVKALTQLLQVRQHMGAVLEIVAVPVMMIKSEQNEKKEPAPAKRKQRYPYKRIES